MIMRVIDYKGNSRNPYSLENKEISFSILCE
jgi:hypothetical protein